MQLVLTVTEGPFAGKTFAFDRRDSLLVGRAKDAHLRFSADDPRISRRHFLLEINPPRCRVRDQGSQNGTFVNGQRVEVAELKPGDVVRAGHTSFTFTVADPGDSNETVPPASLVPRSPTRPAIRGYELLDEIGRGSMGVVYRARRAADGAEVALKTVQPVAGISDRQVELFLAEARVLARLCHPNVVRFEEAGHDGGVVYLVMELVNGPDAMQLVARRGPLPVADAVRVARHALAGLAHAHALGYVHRDVKPANVLVHSQDGTKRAKLADFGLAYVYESSCLSGSSFRDELAGTPAFMAPEQVTHYREAGPPADQYSAAATLYFLLTRCSTHEMTADGPGHLQQLTTRQPIPVRSRRPEVPQGLADALHRALRRDPAERYPDAESFRAALRPWA